MAKFLNSNIVDFSVKGSFGGEVSLDISLADCVLDNPLDSGFSPPSVGSPVLFEYEDFSFYGVLDTYKRDNSTGGSPVYSCQLTNAAYILGGVELILSDYYGSVNSVPNLINIFGYLENSGGQGVLDPPGYFGRSEINSAGISWSKIASAATAIINQNPLTAGSYGRAISYNGYKYGIGLDLLPALPSYYRITNDSINLLDFISDVCSAGGCDFFIRLIPPTTELLAFGLNGMFEVVTISRASQPLGNKVQEFVDNTPCVVSKNYGHELRKDVNSKFVVGSNIEKMHFVYPNNSGDNSFDGGWIDKTEYENDSILPFFGVDQYNNIIIGVTPESEPDEYYFNIDVSDIDLRAIQNFSEILVNSGEYTTSLGEMRAAKKGRDSWEKFLLERDANKYIIVSSGSYTSEFKSSGNLNNTLASPDGDGLYPIAKFGYMELVKEKGIVAANTEYVTVDSRKLTYPNEGQQNTYFLRASQLNLPGGWTVSAARFMEDDLRSRSLVNPDLVPIYQSSLDRLGILKSEEDLLGGDNIKRSSRKEDSSLGNFNDNKVDQLYKRIKGISDTYYNKKFLVTIPFIEGVFEPESNNIRMSKEIINEGFLDESDWTTAYSNGLIPDISGINTLLTTQNKFYPFVKYENCVVIDNNGSVAYMKYDFSEIGVNDKVFSTPISLEVGGEAYRTPGGYITYTPVSGYLAYDCWVKCRVDEKPYFLDNQTLYGPHAVIEVPGSVKNNTQSDYPSYSKRLFRMYDLSKSDGLLMGNSGYDDSRIKATFDNIGGDDAIMHDGEDIVYADLYATPLRDKMLCYGPWYAIGADGKVTYEKNQDLNPWSYGGFDAMNTAGNAKTQDGLTAQTFSEVGSVTIKGSPSLNFGDVLIAGGPYITDISVSHGTQGTTTTYTFQSWTSHRQLSKLTGFSVERNKRITDTFTKLKSEYREGLHTGRFKNSNDFFNKVSNRFIDLNDYNRKDQSHTSHKMFGGQVFTKGSTVVTQTNYNSAAQAYTDYENKAFMSMDGLLRPFSTVSKSGWPSFEVSTADNGQVRSNDINPFQNGNDITALAYGQSVTSNGLLRGTGEVPEESGGFIPYRALGMRMPMIGVGWGYDINDNPVPAGTGSNGFTEDYLYNQADWKAGPIDLRWDDVKKVWRSPGDGGTGGSLSDCNCGCLCTDGYDLILSDGTQTTLVMAWVPPGQLEINVINGHIWLPATNQVDTLPNLASYYPLTWNGAAWTLPLSGYLEARYSDYISEIDGSLVAGPSVSGANFSASGNATFRRNNGNGLMDLIVTINGTINPTG